MFRRMKLLSMLLLLIMASDGAAQIVVNSLDDPGLPDDGLTTLREAIVQANVTGGLTITFDPALAGGTIQPTSSLPAITGGNITIDGDIDNDNIPDIEIDGSVAGAAHGVRIASSANLLNGLIINRFQLEGISFSVASPSSNTVSNCYVGVDRHGTSAEPNGSVGIWLHVNSGASENTLGPGNIVSGNLLGGIVIAGANSSGNIIIESRIGTNVDGTAPIPNGSVGAWIRDGATNNTIGPNNLISGNDAQGIVLSTDAAANSVIGNRIGTDTSGTLPLGNAADGIQIREGASDNVIGGTNASERNIISGNSGSGITIDGSSNNQVLGNRIGTDAVGSTAIPNLGDGILIRNGAHHNTIGGPGIAGNLCSGNQANGITIGGSGEPCIGNTVANNYIGTDADGLVALGNGAHGIFVNNGSNGNVIGPGNILSSSVYNGVTFEGLGTGPNTVRENKIGTDVTGNVPLGNGESGVAMRDGASGNTIGPDNVISGNGQNGVFIGWFGEPCNNNVVENNLIGIVADQTNAIGNDVDGIIINNGSSGNQIGPGNVIGGSRFNEIVIADIGTSGNGVFENTIGTDLPSTYTGDDGVDIRSGASNNTIGPNNLISDNRAAGIHIHGGARKNVVGPGNMIMRNRRAGVFLHGGDILNNEVLGNQISQNELYGVEVAGASATGVHGNVITQNHAEGVMIRIADIEVPAPLILEVQDRAVRGTALAANGSIVTVFSDPEFEGAIRLGDTTVQDEQFEYIHPGPIPDDGTVTAMIFLADGTFSMFGREIERPPVQGIDHARLTSSGDDTDYSYFSFADWSSDGSSVFATAKRGVADFFIEGMDLASIPIGGGDLSIVAASDPNHNAGYARPRANPVNSTQILVVSQSAPCPGPPNLRLVSTEGPETTCLAPEIAEQQSSPNWSSDGSRIAFVTRPINSGFQGYIANIDDGSLHLLSPGVIPGSFSSDGTSLLSYSFDEGIFETDLNGVEIRTIVDFGRLPQWSPDGHRIAFEANGWVWLANTKGNGVVPLVPGHEPRWSPSGEKLVYFWERDTWIATIPNLKGDFDEDGDIDLDDYAFFELCNSVSGPGVEPPFEECLAFDFDDDGDIDLRDFGEMQQAFTGE